jgi:hypothetical protein
VFSASQKESELDERIGADAVSLDIPAAYGKLEKSCPEF